MSNRGPRTFLRSATRCAAALALVLPAWLHGQSAAEATHGAAPSCSVDLTGDGIVDTVVLLEVERRHRLVAMVAEGGRYAAHVLREYGPELGILSCRRHTHLESTTAGAGQREPTIHTTPGAYVALSYPETSEVAYYWRDGAFVEVWLGD